MRAVFLSDAHLRFRSDSRYHKLIFFLDSIGGRIDHLYLAGDFFDFWFCTPEKIYTEFIPVIGKLSELKKNGVSIHLCEGNHDFYLESYFSRVLGMEVVDEWADIVLDGKKILLAHGDTVDRENKGYLFLRGILRSGAFYRFQKMIPAVLRWKLSAFSSDLSKEYTEVSKERLVGKMEAFAEIKFRQGYDAVVLGHCHKPLLKRSSVGGRNKVFATLGDWIEHDSYLYFENGEFRLEFFKP